MSEQKTGGGFFACSALLGAWNLVSEKLPPMDLPVWVRREYADGSHQMFQACRADADDETWLWANCYGTARYGQYGWTSDDAEQDDDYQDITHWMFLPEPPNAKLSGVPDEDKP